MNEKILKELNKLKNHNFIKIEYCCEECENIVYRTLSKIEIKKLINNNADFEPIFCSVCSEENMIIKDVVKEKEFYRENPNFISGV